MKTSNRFNNSQRHITAAVLGAIFALGATAAISAQKIETRSAQVSLADLDLSTAEGIRLARQRVRRTAQTLCSNFSHTADFSTCVDDAESIALRRLDIAKAFHAFSVAKNQ